MASSLPVEVWRGRVVACLQLPDVAALRNTSGTIGTSIITAALLVERIDGSLTRHSLTGLIDIDRTAPLPFTYVLRVAYVLEQGSNEWRLMRWFIRLAAIYRLTSANGLPLVLSAQWLMAHLPSKTAFHRLPDAMAIYRLLGHMLTYRGTSLALQQADNGVYRIGNESFRVVPYGNLPGGHLYADGYKRTDPAIRWVDNWLFPPFSTYLLNMVLRRWCNEEGVNEMMVLYADIGRGDPRYGRLLTSAITEDQGIAVDYRKDGGNLYAADATNYRGAILSGFRPNETVRAFLWMGDGRIILYTTEPSAADAPAPFAQRFPESIGAVRRLLRPFGLERDVMDRGMVVG
ncbi:unnamed protein product [Vitrella brassicaformis CCMP3155]|uniref:Uncharacterized protein n=1 Tax=Vitrella brassicaformis (strain CCMP3155) TaxID=1169540 RepID=A0A0G4FQ80_VITBC|nr:unnamed protein product [Vitrella brassicaformis CCMP3155]|eukprot:CEM16440.1 unnamed protein product [Vitrella brassicaformis CCMP3155]